MNATMKRISALCAGALLLACATTPDHASREPPGGAAAAERNRHATELAERADYAGAIAVWRELTAATRNEPEAAYLFRNLGYALFLHGDYDAALAALEKACLLDPLNARGWQHLGSALRKLGQEQRAALMFRQAEALQRNDFAADYALARGSTVPAIVNAVGAPPRTTQEWATRELDASVGVIDLRAAVEGVGAPEPATAAAAAAMPGGAAAAAPAPEPAVASTAPVDMPATSVSTAAEPQPPVRLEVRNGNGVRGMAARTARRIASESLKVVRLTNEKGFGVERTRIEYEAGFKDAASRLAEKFGAATMVEVNNCWKTDMRLVLGKDRKVGLAAARPGPRKL